TRTPTGPAVAMAWDTTRQCTWLVSGSSARPTLETWRWDGLDWTQSAPAQSPPFANDLALCADPVRGRVVLVAGGQTWEWDGTSWTPTPHTVPLTTFRRSL